MSHTSIDINAEQHSQTLTHHIIQSIQQSPAQAISFHDFMHMALYEPQLGYYVAGSHKIGQGGDFTTAPETSPLYSIGIAQQCMQILSSLKDSSILELGAGSGRMASDILSFLSQQNCLPKHYLILEPSPSLQQRQRETLQKNHPELLHRIHWITQLPQNFNGIILANEVLDAMPVEVFSYQSGWQQQIVTLDSNQALQLAHQTAPKPMLQTLEQLMPPSIESYTSEYNPHLAPWIKALSQCLQQGVVLLIDYGYSRAEYYHPERTMGTLICHYQHQVHTNPLIHIGLQDITASVDFTAVAEAATTSGFELAGYTQQNHFLINNGLESHFQNQLEQYPERQYQLAQQVRTLTLPNEMGERFKVIALQKGFTQLLDGFRLGDLSHQL